MILRAVWRLVGQQLLCVLLQSLFDGDLGGLSTQEDRLSTPEGRSTPVIRAVYGGKIRCKSSSVFGIGVGRLSACAIVAMLSVLVSLRGLSQVHP